MKDVSKFVKTKENNTPEVVKGDGREDKLIEEIETDSEAKIVEVNKKVPTVSINEVKSEDLLVHNPSVSIAEVNTDEVSEHDPKEP
eukprot:CAMPEP_0116976216 /NCGR_PEP_ID=MMETSP0467-20121206/56333_1 /TAXON_ID=283647 /ORGANISM="Mesodinium pulex, Strain SPMC105" /LENGTH=85 /DNA_ID=CAMNT_0004668911 /DNA_START=175 /DNA_END=432 /DNA_ORIENTATION=-